MKEIHQAEEVTPGAEHFRNTSNMINIAAPNFEAAHYQGIMALYAKPQDGRHIQLVEDKTNIVDFVRCSYLGLDNHPDIVAGAANAVDEAGTLHWSCARTRLNFSMLGELESELSDLFNTRVLTFTTVLAANMSALPLLASGHLTKGRKPLVVFDRLAHATLAHHKATVAAETEVVTIPHNDIAALEALCQSHQSVAFVCDGVYSMGGKAPLGDLRRLQEKYGLFLYIDDAHGISIAGRNGAGIARSEFQDMGENTVIAASLGKGFGASGAILMLATAAQELLFRRFAVAHAFSASMNTAAIGAAFASATIHRSQELANRQAALKRNLALFDRQLPTGDMDALLPIRTVRLGDALHAVAAARQLLALGFYTSAIFFPTVSRGEAGLRICLTASHTGPQIRDMCAAVRQIKEELSSMGPMTDHGAQ